jgi:hypothetical protein
MELTDQEARIIKRIYDKYNAQNISAEEALADLEELINADTED